jgi:4-hydroxyphenylpyruvate dioxygenase-like putative hemolysin
MKAHGDGIQHLCMNVPDIDKAVAELTRTGLGRRIYVAI